MRTLDAATPTPVVSATRAFGTPLRVELIRHYLHHPGPQAAAADALGESSANVSRNTQILVAAGVVTVTHDGRYTVAPDRVAELTGSVLTHILGS